MSFQTRKCPRCGYDNLGQALFCFRCGREMDVPEVVQGVVGVGKLIDGALRFIKERGFDTLEPGQVERLREARTKVRPNNLNGEPLTCLHCGTLNDPHAEVCIKCKAPLVVPDDDFNLVARVSARTSIGQVRKNNEDNVSIWASEGVVLALIADGMGGAAAGEEASRLAVEAVQADFLGAVTDAQHLQVLSEAELEKRLSKAVQDANRAVIERAETDPTLKGMGTTSTLAVIRGNRAVIAHVGDSRAYLIDGRDHAIMQVTNDHSFVQALVASGHITPEQAEDHPMRNVLYRVLGQSLDLEVDVYICSVKAADRLVLCSDGLTKHLHSEDIARIVTATNNPDEATLDLIELANDRGGEDNISVVVVMMEEALSDIDDPDRTIIRI